MRDGGGALSEIDEAAVGFAAGARAYALGRPGYPAALVDELRRLLPSTRAPRVLDLAAGTGKCTEALLPLTDRLFAVELVPEMLLELVACCPGVPALNADAHGLPFAGESFDLVSVATAFHWFADDAATAEIARVLRPGGLLVLVSNRRATDRALERALEEQLAPLRPVTDDAIDAAEVLERHGHFVSLGRRVLPHEHEMDRAGYLSLATSMSYVAADAERRAAVLGALERALGGEERVEIGYRCELRLFRRT